MISHEGVDILRYSTKHVIFWLGVQYLLNAESKYGNSSVNVFFFFLNVSGNISPVFATVWRELRVSIVILLTNLTLIY